MNGVPIGVSWGRSQHLLTERIPSRWTRRDEVGVGHLSFEFIKYQKIVLLVPTIQFANNKCLSLPSIIKHTYIKKITYLANQNIIKIINYKLNYSNLFFLYN